VRNHLKTIPVRDANGDQLDVYEIRDKGPLRALLGRTRLVLCTSEPVEMVDSDTFIVIASGERLTRV
jgi:hypothetical protein